jgi:hypothetical protein
MEDEMNPVIDPSTGLAAIVVLGGYLMLVSRYR